MKRQLRFLAFAFGLLFATLPVFAAKDVAVQATCTPQVNEVLVDLIASKTTNDVDNIMVCGTATQKARFQPGGSHGNHHVTTLSVLPTSTFRSSPMMTGGPHPWTLGYRVFTRFIPGLTRRRTTAKASRLA